MTQTLDVNKIINELSSRQIKAIEKSVGPRGGLNDFQQGASAALHGAIVYICEQDGHMDFEIDERGYWSQCTRCGYIKEREELTDD